MDCFSDVRTAGSYSENEWTERLFHCLVFNKIEAELTAPYTAHQIQKSWKTRIPKGIDNRCLLFQGTPDMIIKCRNEGILNLKVKHQEDVEQQEDMHQEGDSSPDSSPASGRFQMGHQMTKSDPYVPNSFLTEKVGELMAALHNSLACRAMRKYTTRRKVHPLTACGLHIHRAVGISYVEVTLSEQPIEIKAIQLVDGVLCPGVFCTVLKQIKTIKH